jgi:redox-sensing transcriptional repressor
MKTTPKPTLRRLPAYLHLLYQLRDQGMENVSSTIIADALKLDATQVRKDIEYTNVIGKPKRGYSITELIHEIEKFLCWDQEKDMVIAGVGSLGTAILGYPDFREIGVRFIAGFDTDPKKIGNKIHNIEIHDVNRLTDFIRESGVSFGAITVPGDRTQEIAEKMVTGGVTAIWNFTRTQLHLGKDIIVENARFMPSLAVLTRRVIEAQIIKEHPED